uniref:Decapping nuclease n=1 Tax=Tanacetum cinerariifolium TaxID=118510 RepID=A0A6L2JX42_TANCI|nr:hypothetical protein [Tanacetum cinerariifolium]
MDSEQEVDLFGEELELSNENKQEEESSQSSSSSSSAVGSSSSSSSDGSSSNHTSGGNSANSGGAAEDDDDEVRSSYYNQDEQHVQRVVGGYEDDYNVVEDDKDLFGSDNEEYLATQIASPFPVPVLPPQAPPRNTNNNNQGRGNQGGRGRWPNNSNPGGPGLLPRPPFPQRQNNNYGYGRYNAPRNDERFVSELKFSKSEETLSRKVISFQEPSELGCYSRVEGGEVYFDDSSLRLFKRLITEDIGADLNQGFDTFIEKKDLGSQGFGDLLSCIRSNKIPLQNMHFVTYRNNLNKIMATAYLRNEPWEMGVHRRKGVVYLDVHKLPERPKSERDRRMCYYGYCFETLATEDPRRDDGEGIHHVDANVEYCALIKTKLGAHRILMGAEMDCCDSTDDGRRFYVELKTSREDPHAHTFLEHSSIHQSCGSCVVAAATVGIPASILVTNLILGRISQVTYQELVRFGSGRIFIFTVNTYVSLGCSGNTTWIMRRTLDISLTFHSV